MHRPVVLCSLLVGLGSLLAIAESARAQERGDDLVDARNIGRAGASTVSNDSGVAVIQNPAGMVRRSHSRVLLGLGVRGDNLEYSSNDQDTPRIASRSAPGTIPMLAYHHGNREGTMVLGILVWGGRQETSLPTPAFGQPAQDVETLFPHRYGGTSYSESWRQLAAGGAVRLGESIGLGASLAMRDTEVRENRRIWAGFAGRDPLLGAERDLELSFVGRDRFAPSASAGLLYAPLELPLEFAASGEFRVGNTFSDSGAQLQPTSSSDFPQIASDNASAQLERPNSTTLRTGLRYLGDRLFLEACVDMVLVHSNGTEAWQVSGLDVVDESSVIGTVTEVRSLRNERSHRTVRGAVDYEALAGFLWLTGGYAWHSPATGQNSRMPASAQLGGHRVALGLLAAHEDYTLTIGYTRRLQRTREVAATGGSIPALNPFGAGTGSANAGRYRSSSDQLGFAVELGW